jgi:hypothetical protein
MSQLAAGVNDIVQLELHAVTIMLTAAPQPMLQFGEM